MFQFLACYDILFVLFFVEDNAFCIIINLSSPKDGESEKQYKSGGKCWIDKNQQKCHKKS